MQMIKDKLSCSEKIRIYLYPSLTIFAMAFFTTLFFPISEEFKNKTKCTLLANKHLVKTMSELRVINSGLTRQEIGFVRAYQMCNSPIDI
ncbi:Predicted protein [Prochlorococcus marinus subsp. marinus str. CCMP1375]|uniref:Uncharacterized protein n=1 Tax=Prochlorococcus marinus (strain SARG / CCMP1375 / SS120) TaxID=167539 RepID=Q7VBT9_PROMA|nr:Predicted protein [Prochlorococcus marinus subsp. marinus str. CCMP1375]